MVKAADPVAAVSTAGTASLPESSAVKTVLTVETLVAVVEIELAAVVVEALVVAGLVVVVATRLPHPERSSRAARRGANMRVFLTASTFSKDTNLARFLKAKRHDNFYVFTFSPRFSFA